MVTSAQLPANDVGATRKSRDRVRRTRYGEIFRVDADPGTGRLIGGVYNTTGLNDPDGTGDSCP